MSSTADADMSNTSVSSGSVVVHDGYKFQYTSTDVPSGNIITVKHKTENIPLSDDIKSYLQNKSFEIYEGTDTELSRKNYEALSTVTSLKRKFCVMSEQDDEYHEETENMIKRYTQFQNKFIKAELKDHEGIRYGSFIQTDVQTDREEYYAKVVLEAKENNLSAKIDELRIIVTNSISSITQRLDRLDAENTSQRNLLNNSISNITDSISNITQRLDRLDTENSRQRNSMRNLIYAQREQLLVDWPRVMKSSESFQQLSRRLRNTSTLSSLDKYFYAVEERETVNNNQTENEERFAKLQILKGLREAVGDQMAEVGVILNTLNPSVELVKSCWLYIKGQLLGFENQMEFTTFKKLIFENTAVNIPAIPAIPSSSVSIQVSSSDNQA